jgi:hypothetical protein
MSLASVGITTLVEYIAAGAAVAGAATAAYESREQGIAASKQDTRKARVEADQARQQAIDNRQRMLAALATQDAQAGVGGVGTGRGTSFGANVNRQITQQQNDLQVMAANSSAQVSLLDAAGANASQAGSVGAAGDIIGGISGGLKARNSV